MQRDELHVAVLGTTFRLLTGCHEAAEQLRDDWSRCLVPAPAWSDAERERQTLLVADSRLPLTRELRHRLTFVLNDRAIDDLAGRALLLHAAGLACAQGPVVGLVAPSGTGKTTAVAELCTGELPWGYVTDETLACLPDGSVVPFAKPLAVIDDPVRPDLKRHVSPDRLGLGVAPKQLVLGALVLLERQPEREAEPALHRVDLLDAVLELIPQTSHFVRLERPVVTLCQVIERAGGVHRLEYREIGSARQVLAGMPLGVALGDPLGGGGDCGSGGDGEGGDGGEGGGVEPEWEALALPIGAPAPEPGNNTLRALPLGDAVRFGDEALLLVGATPILLSPVGLSIWQAVVEGQGAARLDDVHRAAVQEHGESEHSWAVVEQTVTDLVGLGVLA